MKLTNKEVAALALEPGRKDKLVMDDDTPGLMLRITPAGKTWLAQYWRDGRSKRVPLGRHGALTLAQARAAARRVLGHVANGVDVAKGRAEAKRKAESEAAKPTLAELLEQWVALGLANQRERYRREAVRALRVAFAAHLNRRAEHLTRAEVVRAIDALQARGKAVMAARTAAYGRACYAWAVDRGALDANPFGRLPDVSEPGARDRVLTGEEIGFIWRASIKLGWPFGPIVQLLLLTGQRRDEVAGMAWTETGADGLVWTIPKERAKNGSMHIVHLSPEARAVLADVPCIKGQALVFSTNGRTPPSGFSKAVARLNALVEAERGEADAAVGGEAPAPLAGWRLHDFRRTMVSWLASTGTPPHVADKLLNHVQGAISGVAAVYNRAEFLPERRAALECWGAHVAACGGGRKQAGNIVWLHARAGL